MKFAVVTILLSTSVAWAASLWTHVPVNDTTLLQVGDVISVFHHDVRKADQFCPVRVDT